MRLWVVNTPYKPRKVHNDLSHETKLYRKTFCGTYEYMAPEIVNKNMYDYRVDVWALGVLLYELTHNKPPYKGRTMKDIKISLLENQLIFDDHIHLNTRSLIQKILQNDPKTRISTREIISDPWVLENVGFRNPRQQRCRSFSKVWI